MVVLLDTNVISELIRKSLAPVVEEWVAEITNGCNGWRSEQRNTIELDIEHRKQQLARVVTIAAQGRDHARPGVACVSW